MSYPFRKITKEEALNDYSNLQKESAKKMTLSIIGNKACDYFFQRYRVKTKLETAKYSHYDAYKYDKQKIVEYAKKLRKTDNPTDGDIRAAIRFKYGSINQFRPMVAKHIYTKFKPTTVLDISAGWGNRLLAAMSMDINYIGIDSNTNLKTPYSKMIDFYPTNSNITMIFKKSELVDYSKYDYDMIFSSPPYYSLEQYENMKEYENKDEFISEYFKPTIVNSYKHLKKGGFLVMNMPKEMKDDLIKFNITPKVNFIKMPIRNRFNDGVARFEYIYWFQKPY